MADVKIDWCEQHHSGDNLDQIRSLLEAGGDEGPLIVLPDAPFRGRTPRVVTQIYQDVDSYIGSLALNDDENDSGERWVGLVRGSFRNNGEEALAALSYLKSTIDAPIRKSRRDREPPPARPFELTGSFVSRPGKTIENGGDAFAEIMRRFSNLRRRMTVE